MGWARRIRRWALWLAGGFVLLSVALVLLYAVVPPPVTPLMLIRALGGAGISRTWVPATAIDPDAFRAVMAGEDNLFCEHHGFDWQAIRQAWHRNQRGGRIYGGSTITMQTAKNLFLWPGRSLLRKGFEAYFTVLLELFLSKRRILVLYLNHRRMGRRDLRHRGGGGKPVSQIGGRPQPARGGVARRRAAQSATLVAGPADRVHRAPRVGDRRAHAANTRQAGRSLRLKPAVSGSRSWRSAGRPGSTGRAASPSGNSRRNIRWPCRSPGRAVAFIAVGDRRLRRGHLLRVVAPAAAAGGQPGGQRQRQSETNEVAHPVLLGCANYARAGTRVPGRRRRFNGSRRSRSGCRPGCANR